MSKHTRPVIIEGDVAYVALTQGYVATIDASDVDLANSNCWTAAVAKRKDGTLYSVYATRGKMHGERLLHRLVMGSPIGFDVDHIDGDGLNCRKSNLRISTESQNSMNARKCINSTSGVKGVSWHKRCGLWQARIMIDGKAIHLGYFSNIDDASKAYADASARLHGEFGRLK